jgi:mannose/fructose/N-acetylgalactosamine-specific phosphotransferase system component IID
MERQKAAGAPVTDSSINDIKVSLMGPLSGIGDPIFQAMIPMIIAGATLGLAAQGNLVGPVLFVLLSLLINAFSYAFFAYLGYGVGTQMIDKLVKGGMMDNISRAASLLGIIMIGAICAQTMSISLNWVPSLGGVSVNVQTDILDAIMPNLLPVVAIFAVYGLLKKKVSITWIIIGIFVLNIVMGLLGMY